MANENFGSDVAIVFRSLALEAATKANAGHYKRAASREFEGSAAPKTVADGCELSTVDDFLESQRVECCLRSPSPACHV
jgi:hypothetical protein